MLTGLNILVAEDNSLNQRIVNFILQKQNAQVTIVSNGLEALEQLKLSHFDIVLMDLQMPEMDGFDTTVYIRQTLRSDIPIIALSASSFEEDMKRCILIGMNDCISKPFEPTELCGLIVKVLQEHKNTNLKNAL